MSSVKCNWVSLQLAKPKSEYLLEHEKSAIDAHLAQCPHCRESAELAKRLDDLSYLQLPPQSPFVEKKIIDAALEGRMPNQPKIQFFPYHRTVQLAFGMAALGAVAIAAFLFLSDTTPTASSVTPRVATSQSTEGNSPAQQSKNYNLFTFKDAKPLELVRKDKVWGTQSTIVNLEMLSSDLTKVDLVQGKIIAHVTKRKTGEKFVVTSPRGMVEVVGTIFSVELDDTGAEHVRVLEGTVRVTDKKSGVIHYVKENMQLTIGASGPVAVPTDAMAADRELMTAEDAPLVAKDEKTDTHVAHASSKNAVALAEKAINEQRLSDAGKHIEIAKRSNQVQSVPSLLARLARAHRQQKNYAAAEQTYQQLIRDYRRSDAAKNALVALAQLELNVLNNNQSALELFNAYLAATPKGYLAEEAWIGRARVLRAMGRQNELLSTTDSYLSDSARNTFRAEMLLYRANIRLESGNCPLAEKDYQTIIAQWPDSRKARQAQQGLSKCGGNQ
ncbi:MAG: tetratricopeptide repeat protein [Deltaproteobacteria bacterium]|nr:tetratricopeptide repeat protein [Deltaproteobacteria bacterium]MBN2670915.1 tetratricopeptide repeat protein [Deltaproteobacteria bacterium]